MKRTSEVVVISDDDEESPFQASKKRGFLGYPVPHLLMCPQPSCNQWLSIMEMESHELAHKLQTEQEEQQRQLSIMEMESHELAHKLQTEQEDQQTQEAKALISEEQCYMNTDPEILKKMRIQQRRDTSLEGGQGIMLRLAEVLEKSESGGHEVLLSGDVVHAAKSYDKNWGCGWRNIQMMCSWLLKKDVGKALFGSCGFIPDIPSIQSWLDIAWSDGFDEAGRDNLVERGRKIFQSKSWIGATEVRR
jgi:hypothetical protein